jgi:hypothetical protein
MGYAMIRPQVGRLDGGIYFLGDWPNDEAEIKGVPFVGADGHLLSRALRAANLTDPSQPAEGYEPTLFPEARRLLWERRAHSFSYVLPWRPDRETRAALAAAGPKRFSDWADAHAPLDPTAALLRHTCPNVVVPLGPLALWYMTERVSLDDWRGAPQQGRGGLKVLPTYAPDRVMQQYRLFGPLIADLMKVKHEALFAEVRPAEVALWLEPDLGDLEAFGRLISEADFLTIDIETAVGQIVCVQLGTDEHTALVLPFVDYRKPSRSYWGSEAEELRAWEWLRGVLANDTPKIMQNGQYDTFWLLEKAGITVRNYRHDLRLMYHILQPELPKSLAFMGALYTQMPRWKSGVRHGGTAEKRDA